MIDADLIERIVREVIRRLREMEVGSRTGNSSGASASSPNSHESGFTVKILSIDDPVVALATLQGRLDGIRQLRVRGNAVVTPSVRDELRDRKITLTRGEN